MCMKDTVGRLEPIMQTVYYAFEHCTKIKSIMLLAQLAQS